MVTRGASKLTLEERKKLAESLDDPLNRWYRYPIARSLLHVLGGLPLRPDHITYIHICFGLAAAGLVAHGDRWALIVAFFALEIRDILDCYDGVLARAKNMSSPRGRALDETADAVSFIALTIALAIYGVRHKPEIPIELYGAFAMFGVIVGAYAAHGCDFYKRRVGSALKEGRDVVHEELEAKRAQARASKAGALTNASIWADRWSYVYWDPKYANGDPVGTVLARAHRPGVRLLTRFVGLMSWDNGIFVIHLGLLTGFVLESWALSVAYGLGAIVIGRVIATFALGGTVKGETAPAKSE
ncbi:MAG: CDP-alcohol phosphatidyltransferase family protein [Labilithrix sp.]|nr:CDP-alcohol phosphatidyltransferase family protein [Labilithrix sp.]